MDLGVAFREYLQEKEYLEQVRPRTLRWYEDAWGAWRKHGGRSEGEVEECVTRDAVMSFMEGMKRSGMKPTAQNSRIRALNAFFGWLHRGEYLSEAVLIRKLKEPQPTFDVFTDEDIRRILARRPGCWRERRMSVMVAMLVDTGMRMSELLGLRREDVKMADLLVRVEGKGKERFIPISPEMRRRLHLWEKHNRSPNELLFGTREGTRINDRNFLRMVKSWVGPVGSTARVSPHTFRHYFAIQYLSRGGDLYTLSRILGHSDVSVTQIYLRKLPIEQIQAAHQRLSPLTRRW